MAQDHHDQRLQEQPLRVDIRPTPLPSGDGQGQRQLIDQAEQLQQHAILRYHEDVSVLVGFDTHMVRDRPHRHTIRRGFDL
jgi:hypothetical protein